MSQPNNKMINFEEKFYEKQAHKKEGFKEKKKEWIKGMIK